MTPELETSRLWLRPLEIADAGAIQILFPHWEIVRYLSSKIPWPYPSDGAHKFCCEAALPEVDRGNQWHWTLRVKSNPDELIGCVSLMSNQPDHRGFWIGLPWQGRGLMSEACERATDYWFDALKYSVLRTSKAVANTASRRISVKRGMRVIGSEEREYVAGRLQAEIWEITTDEWQAIRLPKLGDS
jgi:[ribosomal protein S5]-alanine N-acetyltransferase